MRGRFAALLILLLAAAPAAAKDIVADLVVHRIQITSGFAGAELTLFGAIEGKGEVIAVVHGPYARGGDLIGGRIDVVKKTRNLGIWTNGPYVRFDGVPGFYAIAASKPLEEVVTPEMRARYQLGVEAMNPQAIEATAPDIADYAAALLRIREARGLYSDRIGHVSFVGERLFRTSFAFPSSVPPGIYTVEVYLAREGRIVDAQSFPLLVNRAGFSADVYDFAHRYSAGYGMIAVLTALLFGWLAHLAFRRR